MPNESKTLYAKLAQIMGEVGWVEKKGTNSFHKYDYVMEADLLEIVRPKLAEHKIALVPSVQRIDERAAKTEKGKDTTVTTVFIQFTFLDGETGESLEVVWAGSGDDPSGKGLYKAYTGAVKYFLMKTFLIPTGDDPERDSKPAEPPAEKPQAKTNGQISSEDATGLRELVKSLDIPHNEVQMKLASMNAGRLDDLLTEQVPEFEQWLSDQADKVKA